MRTDEFIKKLTKEERLAFEAILYDERQKTLKLAKNAVKTLYDEDIKNIEFDRALNAVISVLNSYID